MNLPRQALKSSIRFIPRSVLVRKESCSATEAMETPKEVEEVKIPMPWGHIAGKWHGKRNKRPILCLHGWQDNCGSFDRLIPLLPKHVSYLAIDLPGHGLSSRLPHGMIYSTVDNLILVHRIMREYGWEKISLMGHSMGSLISFMFCGLFPDLCDIVVGLDALKPHVRSPENLPTLMEHGIKEFILADDRNRDQSEPPSYNYEELVERLHLGTYKSISKECCPYILNRNIKRSEKFPDKYYFSRDSRLKATFLPTLQHEISIEMAKRINDVPYLFIKANKSPFYEKKELFYDAVETMKKNEKFELHYVEARHHFHLTDPELVDKIISDFINNYRPPVVNAKL